MTLVPGRFDYGSFAQIHLALDETVRVNRLDREGFKILDWKVPKVEGHDHLRVGDDRSGQYVAIIRIRQIEAWNQVLVAGDEAVGHRLIHQAPGAFEQRTVQVRSLALNVTDPLGVDLIAPSGREKSGCRQADQKIPQRCRVKNTGIVNNDKPHRLVPHVEFLGLLSQLLQRFAASLILPLLVRQEVVQPNTAV